MPFMIYEAIKCDRSEQDKIWEDIWASFTLDRLLRDTKRDPLLSIFLHHLPPKGHILEAGCGLGRWVICLRDYGYSIIGIDFAKESVNKIKSIDSNIPIEFGDVRNTSFEDNSFDAYISLGVVEHFIDGPCKAIKECVRILKPDGILLISVPVFNAARKITINFERPLNFFRESSIFRKISRKENYPKKFFMEYRYTIREFQNILEQSFEVVSIYPIVSGPESLFNHFLEPSILYRLLENKRSLQRVYTFLNKHYPWFAPHQVLWICRNSK